MIPMEVTREDYNRVQSVTGLSLLFPSQRVIFEEISFNYEDECTNYIGRYLPDRDWKQPTEESVLEWFSTSGVDLSPYIENGQTIPSDKLLNFQNFLREFSCGYKEDVFVGYVSCESSSLVVFVGRLGDSIDGVDVDVKGVFPSIEIGLDTIFPDGSVQRFEQ